MSMFDLPEFTPNSVSAVMIYEYCHHHWWQKAKDWIRLRSHPDSHLLYYKNFEDTIREMEIEFNAAGIMKISDTPKDCDHDPGIWCACNKYRAYYDSEQDEKQ